MTSTVHDGETLLHTLATALVRLENCGRLDSFTLPYPAEAQRALDRTALLYLLHGAAPPVSMADLVDRCRERPMAEWPLDLPDDLVGPEDVLLDPGSGRPTELCHEWATRFRDSAVWLHDRTVISEALGLCREYGEPDSYTAFRNLLVTEPVLTRGGDAILDDLMLEPLWELLGRIYRPVPESFRRDGRYAACGRCLTLLTPLVGGGWWCERDRCHRLGPPPVGRVLDPATDGEVLQLRRPLRQFVTGPGRAEMDLRNAMVQLGLAVAMWPAFDSYDLRVTFPDGHVWAIDVKDWANPAMLGQHARPVLAEPPYDEAFWVVPRHRVDDRPHYIQIFERHRPPEAAEVLLLTDNDLRERARRRVRRAMSKGGSRDA